MKNPYVSVVVPIRDNAQGLDLTLRSLTAQDLPRAEWEVIVVDDGSTVPAAETVAPFDLTNLRVERRYPGGGRSRARNHGIRSARGDVVLMLDGDSYAAPDLVRRHAEFHRRGGSDTSRVLLGNRYEPSWDTVNRLLDGDAGAPKAAAEQDVRLSMFGAEASAIAVSRIPWAYLFTHNVSVRRRDLEAIGGFDEDFDGWGREDVELGYRLFEAAGRPEGQFVLDPEAYSFTVPHFRDYARQAIEHQRNTELFRRKHPRFDVELLGGSPTYTNAKVAYYEGVLDTFRADSLGELRRDDLAELVAPGSAVLIVGGTPPPDRSGRTVTWNHRAPAAAGNPHLLGMRTLFDDAEFDDVLHVDLWRFLLPNDLLVMIAEARRIASRLHLVSTTPGRPELHGGKCDTDYLIKMLEGRLPLEVSTTSAGQIITVER